MGTMRWGNSNWPERFKGQLDEVGEAEGMTEVLVMVANVELPCTDVTAEEVGTTPEAEPALTDATEAEPEADAVELEAGRTDPDTAAEL